MHTFADHRFSRGMRTVGERKPWWLLGVATVVALIVGGLGGWAISNATNDSANSASPAAEPVAQQLAAVLAATHGSVKTADPAATRAAVNQVTTLFAKDAVGTDGPSGDQATGTAIKTGWGVVLGEYGAYRIGPVLANDQWAAIVATRTHDVLGRRLPRPLPWVLLVKVRNGKIISETDIYDATSWRW